MEAIRQQAAELDYAPSFQMGHPKAFELAARLAAPAARATSTTPSSPTPAPRPSTRALKIALAYHRASGQGTRTRLIGRERGYHGVGFGGISVGGMVNNRKCFGTLLPGVDHLPHTRPGEERLHPRPARARRASWPTRWSGMVGLHDASTIAAVIVEPVAGSTGVLPPPKGYLERLREICDKHGILLIFDEVITGFGRLGTGFAAEYFGVIPDLITIAKGLTNATVPMGGGGRAQARATTPSMDGAGETAIELFHGYTYSGHPLACAAALATLEIYRDESLFERAAELAPYWEERLHSLRGLPQRHRHPQPRPDGRRSSSQPRRASPATRGLRRLPKALRDRA